MRSRVFVAALLFGLLASAAPAGAEDPPTAQPKSPPAAQPKSAARPALTRKAASEEDAADAQREIDEAVRRVRQAPAPKSMSEALRRLAAVRTSVDWKDMPLAEAVAYIGRLAGFNVIVGPALQKEGLDGIEPLTLKLTDVSLQTLVGLLTRLTGTQIALRDRILVVTTPEAARGEPVLRIHSIGDMTVPIRNFPGPDMNLRPSGAEFEPEPESIVETGLSDPEVIADMLRRFVASETWDDEGVSISADERRLVIRQYPDVQRKIARFLAILRAAR